MINTKKWKKRIAFLVAALMILAAMTVCSILVAWNIMADRKAFWR